MNMSGRAKSALKQSALWAALGVTCLCAVLAGLGFLIVAFYVWLSTRMGTPAALAVTGGVLIAMALLILAMGAAIIKKTKKRYPSLLTEFTSLFGLGARIIAMTVRKDPRKAIIVSVIVGALAEYITSEREKKK
jgi:drug/metabolite transporter superfamily protein YnfA